MDSIIRLVRKGISRQTRLLMIDSKHLYKYLKKPEISVKREIRRPSKHTSETSKRSRRASGSSLTSCVTQRSRSRSQFRTSTTRSQTCSHSAGRTHGGSLASSRGYSLTHCTLGDKTKCKNLTSWGLLDLNLGTSCMMMDQTARTKSPA